MLCVCGHEESDHYEYILNGHPQTRCKACDPMTGRRATGENYELQEGTYAHAMYFAADHDFTPEAKGVTS